MRPPARPFISLALAIGLSAGACDRQPKSPFESHGVRAGMGVEEIDRATRYEASEWKREPMFFGLFSLTRSKRLHPTREKLRWATLRVTTDTFENRVSEVSLSPVMSDSLFDVEMEALAKRWDEISQGRRMQTGRPPGPFFVTWTSADGRWSGKIYYFGGYDGTTTVSGFASVDNSWHDRFQRTVVAAYERRAAALQRADSLTRARGRR